MALPGFDPKESLTSCKISEKSYQPFLRKNDNRPNDLLTYSHTEPTDTLTYRANDSGSFIGPSSPEERGLKTSSENQT